MYIPSRQIGPSSPALVFMLHLHGLMGLGWLAGMDAGSGLDAGLFVGREHKFILAQRLILPDSLIKVQQATGFGGKVRIPRENPATVLPRPNSVLAKPAPDGRIADAGHQSGFHGMAGDFGHAPTRQRHLTLAGQLTSQGLNFHHDFWGEKTEGDPVGGVPPSPPSVR